MNHLEEDFAPVGHSVTENDATIQSLIPQNCEPLVTVAIPVYNLEKYLSYAICSVLNQTYHNWELLIIDDGSFDGSIEIAKSFALNDSRIKVISDGQNKGLAERLNETIMLAKGQYYVRMDGDDIMAVNRIEKQIYELEHHTSFNIVGSSAMIIDSENNIIRSADMSDSKGVFIHPTVTGRTKWFREFLYNPDFRRSQDVELWLRSNVIDSSFNIKEPLLFYREFGIQTLNKNLDSHKSWRKIYKNYRVYKKSFFWFVKGIGYTFIQDFIYILFDVFGKMDYLMKRRKRTPLPSKLYLTDNDLKRSINPIE